MNKDLIRGKTLLFSFDDGPMAHQTYEHTFDKTGHVTFRSVSDGAKWPKKAEQKSQAVKYESGPVRDDVVAVSYLSSEGYTLTSVLDFKTKRLVAFSSNDKMLNAQHGTFEELNA